VRNPGDKSLCTHVRGTVVSSALLLRSNGMRENENMAHQHADNSDPRYSFGLTPTEVEEFRVILRTECGEELSLADAWTRAIEVLAVCRMLLGPIPDDASRSL
jgi:hypothetical protein